MAEDVRAAQTFRRCTMRVSLLVTAILLTTLASVSEARRGPAPAPPIANQSFTPPAEVGNIFTVIDFARADGRAQGTFVTVIQNGARRDLAFAPPYRGVCATSTPSGIVLRTRHLRPDTTPVTILTSGTIVRGPYQGDFPLELLNACYKLVGG
jgi:hypothetical protein